MLSVTSLKNAVGQTKTALNKQEHTEDDRESKPTLLLQLSELPELQPTPLGFCQYRNIKVFRI